MIPKRLAILTALAFTTILPAAAHAADERLLSLVPQDAISVGLARVDDMRRSPTAQTVFARMSAGGLNEHIDRFLRETGLDPVRDVDVVVVTLSQSSNPEMPRVLVAASGRFDPARLANAARARGAAPKSHAGFAYYLPPEEDARPGEHPAIAFPTRDVVLAGTENAVVSALDTIRRGDGRFASSTLGRQMFRIDPRASGWMLFDVQRARALRGVDAPGASPFGDQSFAALENVATIAFWVAESSSELEFGSTAVTSDAETRSLVEDVLKGLLATLRMTAQEKQPDLVKVVRGFRITSGSEGVSLNGSVPTALVRRFVAELD